MPIGAEPSGAGRHYQACGDVRLAIGVEVDAVANVTLALAVIAGLGKLSFWWTMIPAFVAASFLLTNEPSHSTILRANEKGRLGVFPSLLAMNTAAQLALAGIAFWIVRAFARRIGGGRCSKCCCRSSNTAALTFGLWFVFATARTKVYMKADARFLCMNCANRLLRLF